MLSTSKIHKAVRLASHLHRNQTRRDGDHSPYVSHLFSVALLLREVTEDEDVIIAGLMHDSLEDVPGYTLDKLRNDCGDRVADIVYHVTEPLDPNKESSEQLPWLTRKEMYLKRLSEGSVESAMVSCADKIHNAEAFMLDMQAEGEVFTKQFFGSFRNMVWFHEETLKIIRGKLDQDSPLLKRFEQSTASLSTLLVEH